MSMLTLSLFVEIKIIGSLSGGNLHAKYESNVFILLTPTGEICNDSLKKIDTLVCIPSVNKSHRYTTHNKIRWFNVSQLMAIYFIDIIYNIF